MRRSPAPGNFRIRTMAHGDVLSARTLAKNVWKDQLLRDTGIEIDYPARDAKVYSAYIDSEPDGNFVAEAEGNIVGAAYAHTWGAVGWIGPVEVDTGSQGAGMGTALMEAAGSYLASSGCKVIGVETKGDDERTSAFYRSLGYSVHSPVFIYEKILKGAGHSGMTEELSPARCEKLMPSIRSLSGSIYPGMDLTKEFRMAATGGLGKVLAVIDKASGRLIGASIVHDRTVEGIASHLLRALIVDPSYADVARAFRWLLNDSECAAKAMGADRLFFTSSVSERSVASLADAGYKVIGNNVKMLKAGSYAEKGDFQLISWAG